MAADVCTWVGRRIRTLRAERGWTQAMLADHAELAREYVSEVENGKKELGLRALDRIVLALGVSLQVFFKGKQ